MSIAVSFTGNPVSRTVPNAIQDSRTHEFGTTILIDIYNDF